MEKADHGAVARSCRWNIAAAVHRRDITVLITGGSILFPVPGCEALCFGEQR